MTGLDRILSEIDNSASLEAQEILAKARNEAEAIISRARDEAASQAARAQADIKRQLADIERAQVSARELTRRRRSLKSKQEIIGDAMDRAKAMLRALPDDEYFALLTRLAVSAALDGEGAVVFSEADKNRLPQDFMANLSAMLPDGATLRLADETRAIDGGLVLVYGRLEQNCSFDAIFNVRHDEFSDVVRDTLFSR